MSASRIIARNAWRAEGSKGGNEGWRKWRGLPSRIRGRISSWIKDHL